MDENKSKTILYAEDSLDIREIVLKNIRLNFNN